MRFIDLLWSDAPFEELAAAADELKPEARLEAVRALGKRDLARLWKLAEGQGVPLDLAFLLPQETPPGATVEWAGKNSLPAFNRFTKQFTRSSDPAALTGRNTGPAERLVGPGYFAAVVPPDRPGELLFDYTRYPERPPPGWPPVRRNESGLSRPVFGFMHDYFRPVGRHLGIGAAFDRGGRFKGQYFALARAAVLPIGL